MFWHNINKKEGYRQGNILPIPIFPYQGIRFPYGEEKTGCSLSYRNTHPIHLQTEVRQRCTERHSCIQRLQRSVVSLADHLGRSIEIYFHTTIRLADRLVLNRVGAAKALYRTNLTAGNAPPLQVRRHRLGTTL